ncbi:MAG: response regulator transcription factor [Elusimicrobia bacterium]|nr:response regulator transcription factor [Elusimicrobiota bacterium]
MLVLLVSPDAAFLGPHEASLRGEGFEVERMADVYGLPARLADATAGRPALIVLSGAPGAVLKFGVEEARTALPAVRIMVCDSGLGLNDKTRLLNAGADDCQVRLLPEALFLARARNLLRSAARGTGAAPPPELRSTASLTLDTTARRAFTGGKEVVLSRLQFDLLAALTSRRGETCGRDTLVSELLERGHAPDPDRLRACLRSVNDLLQPFGCALLEDADGTLALRPADSKSRRRAAAGRLLASFSAALSNARVYSASHAGVMAALSEVVELARALCREGSRAEVVLSLTPAGMTVDGEVPEPPPGPGDPGTAFLRRFGLSSVGISAQAAAEDLAQLCRASLAPPQMPPRDALDAMLAKASPGSVTVDYSAKRVKEEGRAAIERLAEVLSRNPAGGAALFHPEARLTFKARQKVYKAEGRAQVEAFFSVFPRGLELNVTSCEQSEGGYSAECVVISERYGAAKDLYSFRLQDGLFVSFEAASRLRF